MANYNFSRQRLKIKSSSTSKKISLPFGRQKISPIKLAVIALSILLGLLLLGKLLYGINKLLTPFSVDALGKKEYSWDGQTAINVVLKDQSVSVLHFDPAQQKAVILKIPDEVYVDIPGGFGAWPVRSIYELGEEEQPPRGAHLLKLSIQKLLGLPIDGIIVSSSSNDLDKQILTGKSPWSWIRIVRQAGTDLSPSETIGLLWKLSAVRSDKLVYLDLAQSNITQSRLLADSSRILGINSINLSLFIKENLFESKIQEEGISVAVFNATSHPLMAQEAARLVSNLGADVIIVGNTETHQDKSLVIGPDQKKSLTLTRIQETFAPKCMKTLCSIKDSRISTSRAQINVVLGEDFYTTFVRSSDSEDQNLNGIENNQQQSQPPPHKSISF